MRWLLLLAILAVSGCLLTDRYAVEQTSTDPITGDPVTVIKDLPSPIDQGVSAAASGYAIGGWQGAVAAGLPAILLALWQAARSRKNRAAAEEAVRLVEDFKNLAVGDGCDITESTRQILTAAADRQDARGVRSIIRQLRPTESAAAQAAQATEKDATHG